MREPGKVTGKILKELEDLGADINSIKEENSDALIHFKAALEALKNKGEQ